MRFLTTALVVLIALIASLFAAATPTWEDYFYATLVAGSGEPGYRDGDPMQAQFSGITQITYDPATLDVYLSENQRIRKISRSTGQVTTIHEDSMSMFGGLAVANSVLYVIDLNQDCIKQIDLSTIAVSVFAGRCNNSGNADGNRTVSTFNKPEALAFNNDSSIMFVADTGNAVVRTIDMDASAGEVRTVVFPFIGNMVAISGAKTNSTSMFLNRGCSIRRVDLAWNATTNDYDMQMISIIGYDWSCGYIDATKNSAKLRDPKGIAVSEDDRTLFIADDVIAKIRRVRINSGMDNVASTVVFSNPVGYQPNITGVCGITMLPDKALLLVDTGANRIWRLDPCPVPWYRDSDGDLLGNFTDFLCTNFNESAPAGYVDNFDDCNDFDPKAWTTSSHEECDNVDNNCNGEADEGLPLYVFYPDLDGDGFGNNNDPSKARYLCDQTQVIPGYSALPVLDCNDDDDKINPVATEICNDGVDNNCNNQTNEPGCIEIENPGLTESLPPGDRNSSRIESINSIDESSSSAVALSKASGQLTAALVILIVLIVVAVLIFVAVTVVLGVGLLALRRRKKGGKDDSRHTIPQVESVEMQSFDQSSSSSMKPTSTPRASDEPEEMSSLPKRVERSRSVFADRGSALIVEPNDVKIISKIGQGAFGIVFKAQIRSTEEVVALKKFDFQSVAHDKDDFMKAKADFENEVKLLATLRHPHILGFGGAIVAYPEIGIITEYMEHGTLFDCLYKKSFKAKFSWPQKLKLLHQVALGMQYLHRMNVIHRDLKTQNILLTGTIVQQGGDTADFQYWKCFVAKVSDFGLAKLKTSPQFGSLVVHTKQVGTSLYMAPEVVMGETYGTPCDVFSFGIIMCEVLTEEMPYKEQTNKGNIHIRAAMDSGFRPNHTSSAASCKVKETASAAYAQFVALMQKCWAHEATERPTFLEVVKTLAELSLLVENG